MNQQEADEFKALLPVSRKSPLNFGLALGKKPASTAMVLHRTKAPDILLRAAKKMDDVQPAKSTCGTVSTDGKIVSLSCEIEPPAGLARQCKQFLSAVGLKFKVRVLDAGGNVLDEDGEDDEDAAPGNRGQVDLQKLRLVWDTARGVIRAQLVKLEGAIVDTYRDRPDAASAADLAKRVHLALDAFDGRLVDTLDAALNADDPSRRAALEAAAADIADDYLRLLDSDPLLRAIDSNPFTPVAVQSTYRKTLVALRDRLR